MKFFTQIFSGDEENNFFLACATATPAVSSANVMSLVLEELKSLKKTTGDIAEQLNSQVSLIIVHKKLFKTYNLIGRAYCVFG